MRVLIDECVDPGIRGFLDGHQVTAVKDLDWRGSSDEDLVRLVQGNFDVLLTLDRGFESQHNLRKLSFGIVILHPARNRQEDYATLTSNCAGSARSPARSSATRPRLTMGRRRPSFRRSRTGLLRRGSSGGLRGRNRTAQIHRPAAFAYVIPVPVRNFNRDVPLHHRLATQA